MTSSSDVKSYFTWPTDCAIGCNAKADEIEKSKSDNGDFLRPVDDDDKIHDVIAICMYRILHHSVVT